MIKYDNYTNQKNIVNMKLKTIKEAKLESKTVIIKVDYNVPLKTVNNSVRVNDDTRITITIPTIKYLQSKNCKIIQR